MTNDRYLKLYDYYYQQILVPTDLLVQQPDGNYYPLLRLAELEHCGRSIGSERAHGGACAGWEELEAQKRLVETGKVR